MTMSLRFLRSRNVIIFTVLTGMTSFVLFFLTAPSEVPYRWEASQQGASAVAQIHVWPKTGCKLEVLVDDQVSHYSQETGLAAYFKSRKCSIQIGLTGHLSESTLQGAGELKGTMRLFEVSHADGSTATVRLRLRCD